MPDRWPNGWMSYSLSSKYVCFTCNIHRHAGFLSAMSNENVNHTTVLCWKIIKTKQWLSLICKHHFVSMHINRIQSVNYYGTNIGILS